MKKIGFFFVLLLSLVGCEDEKPKEQKETPKEPVIDERPEYDRNDRRMENRYEPNK